MVRGSATRLIQVAGLIVGLAFVVQAVSAQATPPPRPTPTQSGEETPPPRATPTAIDTPVGEETPSRPTPTSSVATPPFRATPTSAPTEPPPPPENNPPEATPLPSPTAIPTPYLLPVTGTANHDDGSGSIITLAVVGLALACLSAGAAAYRRRQHNAAS